MSSNNNILNELKDLNIGLPHVSMPEMSLPANYFSQLHDEIQTEIHLKQFNSKMPFEVPSSYFDELPATLLSQIRSDEFVSSLPKTLPFATPAAYFDNLSTEILAQCNSTHFVDTLPKTNTFQIPADYFDTLTEDIVSKTVRLNPIRPLRATRNFYSKMSIAASLLIILSLGFLLINQKTNAVNVETQLAQVSDGDINAYIQQHAYEFDNHISYQPIDESKIDLNSLENDIYNSYFDDIPDEEINNFL